MLGRASVVSFKSINLHALRKAEARVSTAKPMNPSRGLLCECKLVARLHFLLAVKRWVQQMNVDAISILRSAEPFSVTIACRFKSSSACISRDPSRPLKKYREPRESKLMDWFPLMTNDCLESFAMLVIVFRMRYSVIREKATEKERASSRLVELVTRRNNLINPRSSFIEQNVN